MYTKNMWFFLLTIAFNLARFLPTHAADPPQHYVFEACHYEPRWVRKYGKARELVKKTAVLLGSGERCPPDIQNVVMDLFNVGPSDDEWVVVQGRSPCPLVLGCCQRALIRCVRSLRLLARFDSAGRPL
jgi:hypothetical protein